MEIFGISRARSRIRRIVTNCNYADEKVVNHYVGYIG